MSFIKQILDKIFGSYEAPNQSNPLLYLSEQLKRSNSYVDSYNEWLEDNASISLMEKLKREYLYAVKEKRSLDCKIHVLESPGANGFAIDFDQHFYEEDFFFLMDYWKERVLDQGYYLYSGSRKFYDKPKYVEIFERYYLKPKVSYKDKATIIPQRFGNISIELLQRDSLPIQIKFFSNYYSGRSYRKVLPFGQLVEAIFLS